MLRSRRPRMIQCVCGVLLRCRRWLDVRRRRGCVRDAALAQQGFVRERVEALRAGWPLDPIVSELLPLESLLALAAALPLPGLRLMNLTTAEGVERLGRCPSPPPASVPWCPPVSPLPSRTAWWA